MSRKRLIGLLLGTVCAVISISCSKTPESGQPGSDAGADRALTVAVVNYPLKYFTERIGGEHVNVVFPAPPDVDPSFWMPDAEIVIAYQQADLILLSGASYAKWVNKVSLPTSKVCDTSAAVADRYIQTEGAVTHAHGPSGEHAHGETAFTVWLDPQLAVAQAEAICRAISRLRPEHEEMFQQGFRSLEEDLLALDRAIAEVVAEDPDRPLVVSHPVYQYFIRRYGLNAKSVHWERDEVPADEQWNELDELIEGHPVKWMIWEGQPVRASEDQLESRGIGSVVFASCGNEPEEGDFLTVMRRNVENLRSAFQKVIRQ